MKTRESRDFSLFFVRHETPFGQSLIACSAHALIHLSLRPEDPHSSLTRFEALGYRPVAKENVLIQKTAKQLDRYFSGHLTRFSIPLQLHGTDFQTRIWELVQDVPYGQLISYGELASLANHPRAARAVGSAMACNPIPIVVPCHRVVPAGRKLGNYTGGTDIKCDLLALEGVNFSA